MISGQQALRSIEQAVFQLRGQESELDAALRSSDEGVARLRADRAALFRQLAQVRLDAIKRETIVFDLDAAERRALDLIKQGEGAAGQLALDLAQAKARLAAAEEDRHARAEAVTKALEALEDLQARVEPGARAQAAWIAQKAALDRATEILTAAENKAGQAEADREAKGKPYRDDPLFLYLWNRKFGQPEYGSRGIVRALDNWVARLVRYPETRANFVMLNEIPTRLRAHAERCKADLDAEKAKLTAIERDALIAAGSEPLEQRHADAKAALAKAEAEVAAATAALKSLDDKRQQILLDQQGGPYRRAIEIVAEADSQETIRELYREAAQTRTGKDDAIVAKIDQTNGAIAMAEQESLRLRQQAQAIASRRAEIEAQRDSFHRHGYDNPMGRFRDETLLSQVLSGIVQGAVQGAVLGQVLQGGFSQRPPRADSDFGGSGGFTLPWPPGGGDGGGFSDGGGDGFRTGGSF